MRTFRDRGSQVSSRILASSDRVGCAVLRQRHQHGLTGAVERRRDAHPAWRGADALVHVGNETDAPASRRTVPTRQGVRSRKNSSWAVRSTVSVDKFAAAVLGAPDEAVGKAGAAHLARRILDRAAILTDLQLEPAARGGGREPERDAAALAGGSVGSGVRRIGFLRRGFRRYRVPSLSLVRNQIRRRRVWRRRCKSRDHS